MPLLNLECLECNFIMEKFLHNRSDEIKNTCSECGCTKFIIVPGITRAKVWLNAKDTFSTRIEPEVNRIMKNVSEGKDKDFIDIAGD